MKAKNNQQELLKEQLRDIENSFQQFDDWDIFCTTADEYAERLTKSQKTEKPE